MTNPEQEDASAELLPARVENLSKVKSSSPEITAHNISACEDNGGVL